MQELLMFMYPRTGGGSCPGIPVLADRFWSGTADLAGQQGRVRWFGSMVRPCSP